MRKIITYLIIYCLTFNYSYAIELQALKFNHPNELLYNKIPDGTPEEQFEHAKKYEYSGRKAFAARAYKEFVERNPKHKLVPRAIYNYGNVIKYDYKGYSKFYNARTTPFELLLKNYPEIYDEISFGKTSFGELAYEWHLSTLWFAVTDLMYKEKKGKDFQDFRKKFCNEMLSKDPRHAKVLKKYGTKNERYKSGQLEGHIITNYSYATYQSFKCLQIHGGLDKTVRAPENSKKTQVGFKIDLLANNPDLSNLFKKYIIIFDFKNFKVDQIISYKSKFTQEVTRSFEIVNIDDNKIRMQQSISELYPMCRKYYKGWGKYVYDSNNVRSPAPYKETPIDDCNVNHEEFNKALKKSRQSNYKPYVYIDFNLQTGEMTKTYFPLAQKKARYMSKRNFKNPFDNFNNFKENEKIGTIVEFLFLAATVYLVISNIKTITSIAKSGGKSPSIKSSGISKGTKTPSPCIHFACSSHSRKIKILKRMGRL